MDAMQRHRYAVWAGACLTSWLASGSVRGEPAPAACSGHDAIAAIQAVKKADTPRERMRRARVVDKLLMQNPACGTQDVVSELIGLLHDSNGGVRYWSAMALGDIGPAAAPAIPALEDALRKEPNLPGSEFPARNGYLFALKKIRPGGDGKPSTEPAGKDDGKPPGRASEKKSP
jgi:hypothetical protein